MDTNAREQIRLVLDHLADKSRSALDDRLNQIYSSHSASGRLRSGFTVKVVLRAMEDSAEAMLSSSIDQVGSIAKDIEAFAMLHTNLESHLRFLELKLDGALRVIGAAKDGVVMSGASQEANGRFGTIRSNLTRQIEIHRFTFNQPVRSGAPGQGDFPSLTQTTALAKNVGGKPVAKHWDSMWAAIAVKLYVGDLQPSSQADVERAMKDWFAEKNLEVGDTAMLHVRHVATRVESAIVNPHRPFTPSEVQRRNLLTDYLDRCSEDELIEEILLPMFRHLGFHRVTAAGHKDKSLEYGKDVWMRFRLPTQHYLYFGIQAKKGKLDSAGMTKSSNANIAEIYNQLLMMLGHEIFDPETSKRTLLDHAFIVAGGEITKQARGWLGNKLDASKRSQVMFMDRNDILDLYTVSNIALPAGAEPPAPVESGWGKISMSGFGDPYGDVPF